MSRKVIITAALSGGGRTSKKHNRHLPETPVEMAEAAFKCWQAGAARDILGIAQLTDRQE